MPDQYSPPGGGQSGGDPDRPNPTRQWRADPPGPSPQDPTVAAPQGWSPSGGMPPQPPPQPPLPPQQPPQPPGWAPPPGPPPPGSGWGPGTPGWSPSQSYGWSPSQPGAPGWPPGPPSPQWGPPPGGGRRTGRIVGLAAVALVAVIALVVGVVVVMKRSGGDDDTAPQAAETTTSTTTEPTLSVAALEGLLPTASSVDTTLKISGLEVKGTREAVYVLRDEDRVSDMDCISVPYVSQGAVYEGTGYTAIRARRMEKKDVIIDTAAATFPTAQDATEFREKITQQWQGCARQPLNRYFSSTDDDEAWMIGSTETDENTAHTIAYEEGGEGWACTHAIGSRGNAALEALVCGNGMTDEASKLLDSMLKSATA